MKTLFHFLFCLFSLNLCAQINPADSSVFTRPFWKKGEHRQYQITQQEITFEDKDTASNLKLLYTADITITESSRSGFIASWRFSDFSINDDNPLINDLTTIHDGLEVLVKLDADGKYMGIENWKKISQAVINKIDQSAEDFKFIPEMDELFEGLKSRYKTKTGIDTLAFPEIIQYYSLHGRHYILQDLFSYLKKDTANLMLFEDVFLLNEVDLENRTFLIQHFLNFDLENNVFIKARMHEKGWLISNVRTKTTNPDWYTTMDEQINTFEVTSFELLGPN